MAIEYVNSINNTIHISIYNYDNKFCHYVSIIQRLHTSPTLNKLCSTMTETELNSDLAHLLLKPVNIYSHLDVSTKDSAGNTGNILSIFTQFDQFFNDFVPKYVHESARNGYVPHFLLVYCYCPIIYHFFPDSFVDIVNEIHVDRTEFDVSPSIAEDIITRKNPFVIDKEFQLMLYKWYLQLVESIKDVNSFKMDPFCSATLEIFPNKDHTGGHAVTLLYGQSNLEPNVDEYFILDDHNTISKFHDYYNKHNERLYDISVRDVDDIMISDFNKNLHQKCTIDSRCKFSSRVTRYVLCLEHNFLTTEDDLLKPELRPDSIVVAKTPPQLYQSVINNATVMPERQIIYKSSKSKLISYFCVGLIIGIIIGVICGARMPSLSNINFAKSKPFRMPILAQVESRT